MCDRNTWLLIKQANILSEIVSNIALDDIKPGPISYDTMSSLYNPYGDADFVDTINKLSAEDKRWTDKLPWNYDEPNYRRGKLQKQKAKEFTENFNNNLSKVKNYWLDQLAKYKDEWSSTHKASDDISKDPIYKRLVEATKKFTPTEFFQGFRKYIPPDEKSKEKGILGTIFGAKFIRKWLKNKIFYGSLGFK